MRPMPLQIPDYTLLRCIGRGSYGEVWLARGVTGVHRAIKIVHRAGFSDARPYEREFSGIQKFQTVSHSQENLVTILHVGRNDAAGYFFYVMELADVAGNPAGDSPPNSHPRVLDVANYQSGTLKHLLRRQGRIPMSECITIAKGLARGVEHLHANGLIHRDIKPSNVIFVNGRPKLADIGLVAGLDESKSFVGTEGFVAPEGPGTVGSDLFGLGRLLYEMSTGNDRLDFPKLPDDLDQIPDRATLLEFNEVVLKACDPDRQRRYASAGEVVRDLLLLEAGKSVRRLRLMETRLALALRTTAVAVVLSLLAVAAWLWATYQAREARQNFSESERNRLHAESALRDVLLNQVRANRQSGWAGQRTESLRLLREAPALANPLAFRNEAIATLALPDIRPWRSVALPRATRVALDRNLTRYATNDGAGAIYLRDTASDRLLQVLPGPGAGVYAMGFGENDQVLGASYLDRHFIRWELAGIPDASTNLPAAAWTTLPEGVQPRRVLLPSGAFAGTSVAGGRELAVQCKDGSIHFVNPTNGLESRVLAGQTSTSAILFNESGLKFAFVRSNECLIHRTETGETLFNLRHPGPVTSLAWHPDGRRLATACFDFQIRLWDTITGQQLSGFENHDAEVVHVEFDASGTLLASSSWDDTTRLWAPETGRALVRVRGGGNSLRLAADATHLAYVSWDRSRLMVCEVLAGRALISLERFSGIYGLSFSRDSRFIAAGSGQGTHLWQWPHFHPVLMLPVQDCSAPAFLPDGRTLLTAGTGQALEWSFHAEDETGMLHAVYAGEIGQPAGNHRLQAAVSEDGQLACLSSNLGGQVYRRDDERWVAFHSLTGKIYGTTISPDGRWLAVARSRGMLEVFGIPGATGLTNLECVAAATARFTPDGRWLMAATVDGYARFRTGTWQPSPFIARDGTSLRRENIAFCRSNQLAALRTSERELSLVDLESGKTHAVLQVPLKTTAVAFSPDGTKVAVSTEKLGVQVWDLALVRRGLADMGLDWAPSPPEPGGVPPLAGALLASHEPFSRSADFQIGRSNPTEPRGNLEIGASRFMVPVRDWGIREAPHAVTRLRPVVQTDPPRTSNPDTVLGKRLQPRSPGATAAMIDLTCYYNALPADGWIPGFDLGSTAEHSLPIPIGTNRWAEVEFDVRGVIQLTSSVLKSRQGRFPDQVSGIPIGQRCRRVHFLHGTDWSVKPGTVIGGYVARYVTGELRVVPITFGADVLDWWQDPAGEGSTHRPVAAWKGSNPASRRRNAGIHVYRSTWLNPLWDVRIESLDFFSTKTACGPFLLAVTVE